MKGPLPDEFPFSRKRKPTRRKATAKQADQTVPVEATALSAPAVAPEAQAVNAAPVVATEVIATPVAATEATPAIAAVAEMTPVVPAVSAAPTAPAAPLAERAPAAPAVAAPAPVTVPVVVAPRADLTANSTTFHAARHATSRASVSPAVSAVGMARVADTPAAELSAGYRGPERRRSPRQSLRAKATYRNDLNPAAAGPVQILNFSMCGLRLWSTRPMKLGERGNVKMEIGPVKWSGRVKIVTCETHDDEGYSLGCEFAANEVARRSVA